MAIFQYNVITQSGRAMTGTIEAASNEQAGQLLQEMGLDVNEIKVYEPKLGIRGIGKNDFLLFNQQLASITQAGIPLEKGLRELAEDVASKKVKKLITQIVDDLDKGMSIEQAFEKREKLFPPLYGKILKAGIETGRLCEMLTSLNRHIEVSNQTQRIIFEALAYPAVVLTLIVVLMTFLFVFVVPKFSEVMQNMAGGRLPALTETIFAAPKYILPAWIAIVLIVVLFIGFRISFGLTPAGRRFKESMLLGIPVLGRVWHSGSMSRMAEAMAMLVSSGSNMPECLRLSAQSSGSEILSKEADVLASQIEQGQNILEAGLFVKMIPKLFLYSIQLGSQRNQLEDNLHSMSDMYSQQTRCVQARLQVLLLPFLIIVLGGIVMMTVLGMFLPMVSIITSLM